MMWGIFEKGPFPLKGKPKEREKIRKGKRGY